MRIWCLDHYEEERPPFRATLRGGPVAASACGMSGPKPCAVPTSSAFGGREGRRWLRVVSGSDAQPLHATPSLDACRLARRERRRWRCVMSFVVGHAEGREGGAPGAPHASETRVQNGVSRSARLARRERDVLGHVAPEVRAAPLAAVPREAEHEPVEMTCRMRIWFSTTKRSNCHRFHEKPTTSRDAGTPSSRSEGNAAARAAFGRLPLPSAVVKGKQS